VRSLPYFGGLISTADLSARCTCRVTAIARRRKSMSAA